MELRHLRYFVAVAEEGSLTVAAEQRLHTAQPSLSRQIRDLEYQVGAELFTRSARGVELTSAGRVFLDHARLALAQVEAAVRRGAARGAAREAFVHIGFSHRPGDGLLPEAMRILRDELPNIEVTVSSQFSPELADALVRGKLDVAFLRREPNMPDLEFRLAVAEPLVVVLPSNHRLAAEASIGAEQLVGETFIGVSNTAPTLRVVVHDYLRDRDSTSYPRHEADNLSMAISLVASTRGVALLPVYAENFLALVGHQSAAQRGSTQHRPGDRLPQGEFVATAQAVFIANRRTQLRAG
ncbi:MAG: LysR substrate-binding domain-containing protein [Rhodospirillales bacterium]